MLKFYVSIADKDLGVYSTFVWAPIICIKNMS